jgi:hypothetical protein
MKRIFTLIMVFAAFALHAQERYLDEIFENVTVTEDVEYASNVSVLPALQGLPPMVHCHSSWMFMSQKVMKKQHARLILVFHTGNFLPQYERIGSRDTQRQCGGGIV